MRGKLRKQENRKETKIERDNLSRYYCITLNKDLCNGCGICAQICPKEAIKENPARIEQGVLVEKPTINFDTDKCILCGECTVLCPLNALTMKIDENEIAEIVKNEAFPSLLKDIQVAKEEIAVYDYNPFHDDINKRKYMQLSRCKPECGAVCEKECPTKAIQVSLEKSENDQITRIIDVSIDQSKCIYCKRCELACPFEAIRVKKPFYGTLELETSLCPKGCTACQDICPAQAIARNEGKLVFSRSFCIFCSACQKVCPNKAISVRRDLIFHTDIGAAAWLTALKKLASFEGFMKEVRMEATRRRVSVVERRRKHILM